MDLRRTKKGYTDMVMSRKDFAEEVKKTCDIVYDSIDEEKANTYDPILISMVRKHLPNMMAYDICGVQPMSAPTGAIFGAMHRGTLTEGRYKFPEASDELLEREGYRGEP
jgi:hypothetical protein